MKLQFFTSGDSYVNGMPQEEVDVYECLHELIEEICDGSGRLSDDEVQQMIEGKFTFHRCQIPGQRLHLQAEAFLCSACG